MNFHCGSGDGSGGGFEGWVGVLKGGWGGGVSGDSISCTDPADYGAQGGGGAPSQVGGPFFIRSLANTVPPAPPDVKVGNYREAGRGARKATPTV